MNEAAPLFGDILVKLGLVSAVQVQEALVLQSNEGTRIGEARVLLGHLKRERPAPTGPVTCPDRT
jgi:adenylate cyclase